MFLSFGRHSTGRKISLLLLLVFSQAFCLSTSKALCQESIKVGAMLSLTGNWSELSKNIQQGMLLAGEEINAQGGVLNRAISFSFEDTDEEKSGGKVVSAYRRLRAENIGLLIGPTGAPGFLALSPIALKDDIVLITPSSPGSFYKQSPRFFNTGGDNYTTTKAIAERVYADGNRKVAIFGSLQPWENEQARIFRETFTALGGEIVAEVSPQADQTVLNTEALKIVHSAPEAVFFAIYNQMAHAGRALKQLQYAGRKYAAQIDTSHLTGSFGGLENTEAYLFRLPSKHFAEKYQNRFHEMPKIYSDSGYDAIRALAEAIKIAGSAEPAKVSQALRSLKTAGSADTQISFDSDGLLERTIVLQVVKGDTIVAK